jgi:3-keto-5-aminohexanoate cleavage enzyme
MEHLMEADKLLITVAPCIPPYMAKNVPGLDLSPHGIAAEVIRACNAGANIAHLHVWNHKGSPTTDLQAFEETIDLIKAGCDIIIEGSTGGFNELTPEERSVSLKANIELASLNPGSVNYDQGVYINSPVDILYWASEMHRKTIQPDIAIFEAGMIANSLLLAQNGLIDTPYLFTFVLGQQGALPATPKNLLFLTESVPTGSLCFVARHSGWDMKLTVMNMTLGGHARAGFEDTPYYIGGELASSNAQLIERIVRSGRELGREPASPEEARQILGFRR